MARRKQREPRRSAAYTPDLEIRPAVLCNGQPNISSFSLDLSDGESMCETEAVPPRFHDPSLSGPTNPGAECSSPPSGGSGLKSASSREGHEEEASRRPGNTGAILENLARMKDVYANLISVKSGSTSSAAHSAHRKCRNGNAGAAAVARDWHRAALAKTLRHPPCPGPGPGPGPAEPALFSTVQLYRQSSKLYGAVFAGASKFRCKDCRVAYDTLVDLTVHMNRTGHYRDDNAGKEGGRDDGKRWSKPRKRSLLEMEGKEEAQKVLKCMYCGHSFESLQDLSVHMIKTRHYQKVPLKAPVLDLPTKVVPGPGVTQVVGVGVGKGILNPDLTPNSRYGYQNGAAYTNQWEARKEQILTRVECGSSRGSFGQLTDHVTFTGHLLNFSSSQTGKGERPTEDKTRAVSRPPTATQVQDEREEGMDHDATVDTAIREEQKEELYADCAKYLGGEELEKEPDAGADILRSLENAVSSAISKAQAWSPAWELQRSSGVKPGLDTLAGSDPGSVTVEASVSRRVSAETEKTVKVEEMEDGEPTTGLLAETPFIPRLNVASGSSSPSLEPLLTLYQISNINMDPPAGQNETHPFLNDQPIDLRTRKKPSNTGSLDGKRDDPEGHTTSPLSPPDLNATGVRMDPQRRSHLEPRLGFGLGHLPETSLLNQRGRQVDSGVIADKSGSDSGLYSERFDGQQARLNLGVFFVTQAL